MRATRFEFGNTGLFHALDLLDECDMERNDAEDYEYAKREFENDLDIPDILNPKYNIKTQSFFTDLGLDAFKTPIDILCNLFIKYAENTGLGKLKEITKDITENTIIYKDDYQIIIQQN